MEEILAPVGGKEQLLAAVRAGACGPPCPLPAKGSPSPILGKGEILAYLQQVE